VLVLRLFTAVSAACVLGAFPTGWVVGKLARGIDVPERGSGSSGATNVGRVLGWRAGVFAIDALKGFALRHGAPSAWRGRPARPRARPGASGRDCWPSWATCGRRSRGGAEGGAWPTAAGVLGVVEPLALVGCGAAFGVVLAMTRTVSLLASIAAAQCLPLVVAGSSWAAGEPVPRPLLGLALALARLIPLTHRDNLARIRAGREPTLGRSSCRGPGR